MNGLRLSPEETAEFLHTADRLDGFADGARAMAEYAKKLKLNEIVAAREPAPEPPKE
jgi:hypothetical protein